MSAGQQGRVGPVDKAKPIQKYPNSKQMVNTMRAKQNKWASLLLCSHNGPPLTQASAGSTHSQGSTSHLFQALQARPFLPISGVPYPFLVLFFSIALSAVLSTQPQYPQPLVLSLFILFSVYSPPLECRPMKAGFHFFCLLLYPKCPEQYMAHSRHSVSVLNEIKWMDF